MNHNLTPPAPLPPMTPLEERLSIQGYRSLLADHCQLTEQHAALTEFATATWESLQELRRLLDLPRQPLPLAASRACATQIAARPMSARPPAIPAATAVMLSGEES